MDWSIVLYLLGVFAVIGLYWWFKVGRHGSTEKYYAAKLGLVEGEAIVELWGGAYHLDRSLGSYVWEAFGAGRERGAQVILAITSSDRFVIGALETSARPISFRRGDVYASGCKLKPEFKRFRTKHGREPALVVLLTDGTGRRMAFDVPRSCLLGLQAWCAANEHAPAV